MVMGNSDAILFLLEHKTGESTNRPKVEDGEIGTEDGRSLEA